MDPQNLTRITTFCLVFAAAVGGGIIAKKVKLPLLVGYIIAGLLFGNLLPQFWDRSLLQLVADVGVTLLLFTLGVEFSFHRLRRVLGTMAWAAVSQILISIFIFLLLLLWFSTPFLVALFVAVAGSLSSTAVVVKLLSERGELDSVPGQLTTGWLVVQDLAVVPLMLILPALVVVGESGSATFLGTMGVVALSLVKATVAIILIVYLGRHGIPLLLNRVAALASREVFLLTTVGLVFLAAIISAAFGLSAALGAFIAGLLVAETSQNHAIFAEVRPLRDLFAVIFFVSLGMVLPANTLFTQLPLLLALALLVMLVKWFLVFGLARYLGYHRKSAFLAAVGLTQMSEFGFIIAREGVTSGALSEPQYVFVVALTFITIALSVPLISHDHRLYYWFYQSLGKYWPKIFPQKPEMLPTGEQLPLSQHVVICGYGRVGRYIGRALQMAGIPFLVVDYNTTTIAELKNRGVAVVYGDPADKDVLDYAQVDLAKVIIIAIPDQHTQEMVINNALMLNKRIRIICRTHHEEDQRRLKSLGVHLVIQPEFEAALSVVARLLSDFGIPAPEISGKVSRLKIEHGVG